MSPCDFVRSDDGRFAAILCSRGPWRPACRAPMPDGRVCGEPAPFLCDGAKPGGKTCDLPICSAHALHVGHGRDLCPTCAREYQPQRRDPATMPKRIRRTTR